MAMFLGEYEVGMKVGSTNEHTEPQSSTVLENLTSPAVDLKPDNTGKWHLSSQCKNRNYWFLCFAAFG